MSIKKIGILGSGNVGKTLGRALLRLGYSVKLGSRSTSVGKNLSWAEEYGANASCGTFSEAASFGEALVLATYGQATIEVLKDIDNNFFHEKIVIDTTNPLKIIDNRVEGLFIGITDSLGEQVQSKLGSAFVVKAFNSIGWQNFISPTFDSKPDLFICGDNSNAKKWAQKLCDQWGWNTIDLGNITNARWIEALVMIWIRTCQIDGNRDQVFKIIKR